MHEVTIFKRQDEGNNRYDMVSIELDDDAQLLPSSTPEPNRRMEFYGDSVTCGERCEALCYEGQADPDEDLSGYSNSWYSYASITARNLNAQAHLVAQGGASLIDGIGWFHAPHYLGMESIWIAARTIRNLASLSRGISRVTRRMWWWLHWDKMILTLTISWRRITTVLRRGIGVHAMPISCVHCARSTRKR